MSDNDPVDWRARAIEAEHYLGRILRAVRLKNVSEEIEFARTRYGESLKARREAVVRELLGQGAPAAGEPHAP